MNRRHFLSLGALATLAGCGGIPLRSLPQLMRLSGDLLDANPAEFRVALQVDARIAPPSRAVPMLLIRLKPKVAGAFEPVDKKLPLQATTVDGATVGLQPAPPGRHWLLYALPPQTQVELSNIQKTVRQAQAQPGYQKGGELSLGIEQDDLAITRPELANTRWDTWMQVQQSEGFFEVWSGTPKQILSQAAQMR